MGRSNKKFTIYSIEETCLYHIVLYYTKAPHGIFPLNYSFLLSREDGVIYIYVNRYGFFLVSVRTQIRLMCGNS